MTTNYARNIYTGEERFFSGPWRPQRPTHWASWRTVPGSPSMRLIGEGPVQWKLRRLGDAGNREAGLLREVWDLSGWTPEQEERARQLTAWAFREEES